jgi:hypothetical protein
LQTDTLLLRVWKEVVVGTASGSARPVKQHEAGSVTAALNAVRPAMGTRQFVAMAVSQCCCTQRTQQPQMAREISSRVS